MNSIFTFMRAIRSLILTSSLLLIAFTSVFAQQQATDGATPLGLSPGAPAGSYPLSDFEDVNLFNGTLNVALPLIKIGGRGEAGYSLTMRIDHKWLVQKEAVDGQPPINMYTPQPGWWTDTGWTPIYSMGRMEMRQGGSRDFVIGSGGCGYVHRLTLTRLTFTAPDGTEYELRDQGTNGQPVNATCTAYNRGTIFVTADGSAATFISDTNIFDYQFDNPGNYPPSGYMMLRNGMRYRIDNGNVTWMRDRNGNKLTFTYDTFQRLTAVTDSLNRQVTISYNSGSGTYDQITYKGFGGATRSIKVYFTGLLSVLRSDFTPLTSAQMFPELNGASSSGYPNPLMVSAVELPNGKQYQFRYNTYAELTRVVLPTGGAIEYDYAAGLTDSATGSGVVSGLAEKHVYRRVIERRVYPDGGSGSGYASKMTYSRPETNSTNAGYVTTDQYNASGTLLTRAIHYFYGSARASFFKQPTEYPAWTDSREYKTEVFAANGTTLLRRVEHTFEQRANVSWWGGTTATAPPNDVRLAETVTTLADTKQLSKQVFDYDDTVPFNNQNSVKEYDYGSGAVGSLARETRTTYLTGASYTGTSVHVRNLQTQVSIYDGTGVERARTTYEIDNYVADTNHAALTNRSSISGFDSAFNTSYTTRGNVTGTTKLILSGGSVTSYSQYDIAGNVTKVIDPRGYTTEFFYADSFGAPNGEARINSAPLELSGPGLASYAFPTSIKNPLNHWTYSQFDFYLGAPVDGEDINGFVASGSYSDSLDRPTQVRRAAGTAITNQTTFTYDDTNRIITTSSDRDTNNDNLLVKSTVYDQMGRTIETRQYVGGGNYSATQSQYDALGRLYKTSNPFNNGETPVWTTTLFDELGRRVSVTTPDNAVVSTSYSGNSVTATDQALKKRKTVTDALGRLKEVYEDPTGLNYQTSYDYDVLDDLIKVTQGTQQRFFMYDSLKRLIRARNPEQSTNAGLAVSDPLTGNSAWSFGYQYDANNNLTQKTDTRGVVSTYVYDALNRTTTIDYSDTASINPDVKWFYDGATNGKGRFWYFYKGGDISVGSNVDHKAVDSYDALGRPTVQRQLFKLDGTWSPTYQISRGYNLAGAVTSQTYPSGHTVSYAYDAAGRVVTFSGNLGDGTTRTYSSNATYSPFGGLSKEQFGTTTPTYHKLFYNIRGQLFDTRVSSVNDMWDWNRGRLIFYYSSNHLWGQSGTDNNGNVMFAETWIPPENAVLDQADTLTEDRYTYDALNRVSSVAEQRMTAAGGWVWSQQFQQSYIYDRWGNRTINPTSWGTGINVKQFSVDTATNRLGVPVGQTGTMSYDAAGNLTTDTYTGVGGRTYDAENKMLTAVDFTGQTSRYTYDADGNRTRRQVASSQEEWQIYGMNGELVAEYRASSPATAPEKEYGHRNGQLLITATGRFNVALAANGAVATASSTATGSGFSTTGAINGNYRGPWGNWVEGWNDNTPNSLPDWLQVDFAGSKTIDEISVFSLHDNYTVENTPTETQTFTLYGLVAFNVQYWNGSSWVTVTGGNVTGNNKVWRKFTFSPITTSKIRVTINAVPDSWSRVVEIQAFGTSAGDEKVQWLVPDQLGTPRMVLDQSGSLASVKRHDYLPFGEELLAGVGGRTVAQGYAGDGVRQQFTSKERDVETGLDYFLARYYSSTHGRFTSPDEFAGGPDELYTFAGDASDNPTFYADLAIPQSLNKYQYSYNNPLRYVDLDGHAPQDPCKCTLTPNQARQAVRDAVDTAKAAADAVADATGITSLAEKIRKYGPQVGKYILENAGKSAAEQDLEDAGYAWRALEGENNTQEQSNSQSQAEPQADPATGGGRIPDKKDPGDKKKGGGEQKPKKERTVEGTRVQRENIEHAQKVHRRAGRPDRIGETKKSKQNEKNELRKIKSSKDVEDP